MSTVRKSRSTRRPRPEDDPFRYGWRYVQKKLPNGDTEFDQIPLTLEDVLHPEEGDVIVNDSIHDAIRTYLKNVLESVLANVAMALVLSDCRVAWDVPGIGAHGPDVAVIFGVRRMKRIWTTFNVAKEGVRPEVLFEITSPDTRKNDLVDKHDHYYRVGVPYYVIIDDTLRAGQPHLALLGFRRGRGGYVAMRLDKQGRLWIPPLKLWLALDGDRVAFFDEQNRRLGNYTEIARTLAQETQALAEETTARAAAEARVKELEAELRRLRSDE